MISSETYALLPTLFLTIAIAAITIVICLACAHSNNGVKRQAGGICYPITSALTASLYYEFVLVFNHPVQDTSRHCSPSRCQCHDVSLDIKHRNLTAICDTVPSRFSPHNRVSQKLSLLALLDTLEYLADFGRRCPFL